MTMFVFWGILAISSVFLILRSGTMEAYKASMRYLGIQILSGVLLLAGATMITVEFGSLEFDVFLAEGPLRLGEQKASLFIFIALGIKAAFPFLAQLAGTAIRKRPIPALSCCLPSPPSLRSMR